MNNLYYIENVGCDDETIGLAEIPEDSFPLFKNIIKNLNKNSNCGCMPTIRVFKIDESFIRPATEADADYKIMHTDKGNYVFAKEFVHFDFDHGFVYEEGVTQVI